jgi:hypothetical protein
MTITQESNTVDQAFYQPLNGLAARSAQARPCPEFTDEAYVRCGVQRVVEDSASGRAFLQEHGPQLESAPTQANYFATLHSARRHALLADVNDTLRESADLTLPNQLADIPELATYVCFAVDGHWHQAAAHDPRHVGAKMAVGHFYSLNLHTHTLRPLAAAEGLHEHDMSALKRIRPKGLRQDVPKGSRVLIVYDRAGIDFDYWQRCRKECAVYFLSRRKENMVLAWEESTPWDRADPRNRGVQEDWRVTSRAGHALRLICYLDPVSGQAYEFLTNEMDLPPGVLAELYRRRWDVEKVFDELKNKLGGKKAWATSQVSRQTQALFLALTHNLLLLYEQTLEDRHEVHHQAEDRRPRQRLTQCAEQCRAAGHPLSTLVLQARRATQRSVKFIRWIRQSLRDQVTEATAVLRLKTLYATL